MCIFKIFVKVLFLKYQINWFLTGIQHCQLALLDPEFSRVNLVNDSLGINLSLN